MQRRGHVAAVRAAITISILVVLAVGIEAQRPRRVNPQEGDPSTGEPPAVNLHSDLVTLTVAVTDPSGKPLTGLDAREFRVLEDGVPQVVEHFGTVGDPYSLVLVLDVSGSTASQIGTIRDAAAEFIAGLGPEDRLGLIVFSSSVEIIGDLTSDRHILDRALQSIGPAKSQSREGKRFDASTGTAFYDAAYLACTESPLATLQGTGRRAVVILSDCVDSNSTFTFPRIVGPVERSGIAIYVLQVDTQSLTDALLTTPGTASSHVDFSESQLQRFYDVFDPASGERARASRSYSTLERLEINRALYDIARQEAQQLVGRTGGRLYQITSLAEAAAAYRQIASELHTRYSLGYYPTNRRHDGSWRAVRVEVAKIPRAAVTCRPGYWAPQE